jgi:D-3-phosphoglycerate dehydrogenase
MSAFTIVLTDQVFPAVDLERELLQEIDAELVIADGSPEEVARLARDADGLLNTYFPIDKQLIAGLSRCRVIARYGIGVDNIDLKAASERKIVVTNVPDYCVEEVASHTVALVLGLIRQIGQADAGVRDGMWGTTHLQPIRRLSELTVGLIGYGRIAGRVGDVMATFGCRLLVHDPFVEPAEGVPELVSLEQLLSRSDIVTLHAPLTPATRGLIGTDQLRLMKPTAVLVNTSRGGLVSLEAVAQSLRSQNLAGAGIDVFESEPPPSEMISDVPNLLVTPHMAYYSEDALAESQRKATRQIINVLSGAEPDYTVCAG